MKTCLIVSLLTGALALAQTPGGAARGLEVVRQSSPTSALTAGRAYALIIGTSQYNEWPHLDNPEHDAQDIVQELKTRFGYNEANVKVLLSPTKSDVSAALRSFIDKTFGPNDSLLIFFAGHGKYDEKLQQGYLVFKDSKKNDPLNDSYFGYQTLTRSIDLIGARHILLVLDACFGGTIDKEAHRGGNDVKEDNKYAPDASKVEKLSSRAGYKTRLYLTSGGKEYVNDGTGRNSPFAAQLLRVLRNPDNTGLVTSADLWDKAQNVVRNGQHPEFDSFGSHEVTADFWLVKSGTLVANVTAPAAPIGTKRGDDPAPVATTAPGTTRINPSDGLAYVFVPPGEFMMGCSLLDPECGDKEKPRHMVSISRGFWLGQTEMTQPAYQKVVGSNPSSRNGVNLPVDSVLWSEADKFCKAVGGRLPTEAEWEYAARAGSTGARYGDAGTIGWSIENSGRTTHPVKSKAPNAWGLYDMLGNVYEWAADWYDERYYSSRPAVDIDPNNQTPAQMRILRGSSWMGNSSLLRASFRSAGPPDFKYALNGFRCVLEVLP